MDNKIFTSNHILSSIPVHEAVYKLKEIGYDGMEVWAEGFFAQKNKGMTSMSSLLSAFSATGLSCVVHGPTKDPSGKKYSICSKDASFRKKSVNAVFAGIDLAKSLNASLINIHPGNHGDDKYDDEFYTLNLDSLERICDYASRKGVIVSMETMEERKGEFIRTPNQVLNIIHTIGSQNFGMTLDIVHGYTHGKADVERYLKEIKKDINHLFHCHVSGHSRYATHVPFAYCEIKDFWSKEIRKFTEFYHGRISIEGAKKDKPGLNIAMSEEEIVKDNLKFIKSIV